MQILGTSNPVILVANKLDLLPKDIRVQPIERWIKAECKYAEPQAVRMPVLSYDPWRRSSKCLQEGVTPCAALVAPGEL